MAASKPSTAPRFQFLASGLVLAGALVLAACSGSSGGASSTTNQPTPPAQGAQSSVQATKPAQAPATPTPSAAAKSSTSPASASVDACSLLTEEEVKAAIGKAVAPVKETVGVDANVSSCSYQDAAHKPLRFVGLTVYALSPAQAKGLHEATKGGGRNQTAVAGLGEDAYWDKDFLQLSVLKGGYAISLSVTFDATDDQLKAAQALAAKAVSRLP